MHNIAAEGLIWKFSIVEPKLFFSAHQTPAALPAVTSTIKALDAHQSKHSACARPCDDQPRGTEKPLPQPAENSYKTAHKEFSLYNLYYQDMPPITVQGRDPE